MTDFPRRIAWCSITMIVALLVVGAASHGVLRHIVQTLPLWGAIVLGFRKSEAAKWAAAPCFVFWLGIMVLIWLYLTGLAHVISGSFSTIEIAMTLVVGVAAGYGLALVFRWRTTGRPAKAAAIVAAFGILQVLALRISLLPPIAGM